MASGGSTVSDGTNSLQRRESCETVCSSRNSSCFLQRRKPSHPLANPLRLTVPKNTVNNTVKQRVLSAKLLKLRSLQSQLNDANFHLAELQQENRALKNLHTRQDKALSKYEGTHADLPKLLKSHEEETRILTAKNKVARKSLKEATDLLKTKEDELLYLREHVKTLQALVKNKNLVERQSLTEQVDELKQKLKSSEDQVDLLNRKIALEAKSFKFKLNGLTAKNKRSERELANALTELDRVGSVKSEVKFVNNKSPRTSENLKKPLRPCIGDYCNGSTTVPIKTPTSSKPELEAIMSSTDMTKVANGIMCSPSDNIKARLSSGGHKDNETDESLPEVTAPKTVKIKSRPTSGHKLDKLIHKTTSMKIQDEADQQFSNFCNTALSSVQNYTKIVDQHVEHFNNSKSDTELLLESLHETDALTSKIRCKNFLESKFVDEDDDDIANEIWQEEYTFRNTTNSDQNGNVQKKDVTKVTFENKDKLLATLRAIDNGEEFEDVNCFKTTTRGKVLFADVSE